MPNGVSATNNMNNNTTGSSSSSSSTASSSHPLQHHHYQHHPNSSRHVPGSTTSSSPSILNVQHNRDSSNASTVTPTRVPPCLPLPSPPLQGYPQPQLSFTATTTTSLSSSSSLSSNNSSHHQHPTHSSALEHHHYYGLDPPTMISSGIPQTLRFQPNFDRLLVVLVLLSLVFNSYCSMCCCI